MNDPLNSAPPNSNLVHGLKPEELFAAGLQAPAVESWTVLTPEEVAMMLPELEISRIINQGGMGAVYEGWQKDLRRRVAVKLLSPKLTDTPGQATRFRYEARLMAQLSHPGIVQIHEAGETAEGNLYYVMELIDGEDLATRMHRERLSIDDSVSIVCHVAEALQAAHALGVVHRDVKPGNILLPKNGPPKLGDFGLALATDQASDALRLTRAGTTLGTLEYAAPEQLSKAVSASPASDVYSLGVLTYELLTGELPRGNFDPPSVRNEAVDPAFDSVVLRAMQTDPARRYKDAGEFGEAFLHAADRRRQQELRDQAVRRKMLRRAWMVVALAVVALVTGGSALMARRARQESEERRAQAESAEQRMAGLFQFLLTDLRQRLEPTGNLGAMESVLEKAVEHFRREYESAGRSPESALKLAEVLVTKAHVIGVRGKNNTAEQLHTEALQLCEQALRAAPENIVYARRVFDALRDRAAHRRISTDYVVAMEDARRLVTEAGSLMKRQPDAESRYAEVQASIALAASHGHLQQLEEAHQEFLRAKSLLQELVAKAPEVQTYASELAHLDTALGSNAEARGDFVEMLKYFTAWHDYAVRSWGRESSMYSHAAFRMGVALQKLRRPAEAIPFLKDAVRLAEADSAKLPGHKQLLTHLSWSVRLLAECHEALGLNAEAAPLRRRLKEVDAQLASAPEDGAVQLEAEFARLVSDSATGRKSWWAFCQRLQRPAAALPDTAAAQKYYEEWLTRANAAASEADADNVLHLVPAFIHNRLSAIFLEEDPARSGQHAKQALALREQVAAAHPDDPELQRDVLSSACHCAAAALGRGSATEAEAALQKIATCARQIPADSLKQSTLSLYYAERSAVLLEAAVARWPAHAAVFFQTGSAISAALLAPIPGKPRSEGAEAFHRRLTGQAVPSKK